MARAFGSVFVAALILATTPGFGQTFKRPLLVQPTISPDAAYAAPTTASAQVASADLNGYTPAPVPDADEAAPVVHNTGPAEAELAPNLFTSQRTYRGEGFTPGSTAQAAQNRNVHPAPGISLNVPLE